MYFKRVICAILAIVLCVGTFLMFHTEARAVVVDWLRRQFAHSTYYGPTDGVYTHIQPSRERPAYYELDWLPEGYDLRSRHMTNEDGSVVCCGAASEIELQYYFATKATHVYVSNMAVRFAMSASMTVERICTWHLRRASPTSWCGIARIGL